jgi:hypothetical protein
LNLKDFLGFAISLSRALDNETTAKAGLWASPQ